VNSVKQVYSEIKEAIYQGELAEYGKYSAEDKIYSDIQTIAGDPMTEMLEGTIEDLWSATNSLVTDPSSLTYKITFRESTLAFLEQADNINEQLTKLQNEVNLEIEGKIEQINEYAYQIDEINKKIGYCLGNGGDANELKDQRSYIIEELSNIINIDVEDCSDGFSKAIRIGGGYLVSSGSVFEMELVQNQEGSIYSIPKWKNSGSRVDVTSGELKGLLDARGFDIVGNLANSSNGSPKEKTDIVVSIDPNTSAAKLDAIKTNISSMLSTLDNKQVNYKLYMNIMGTNTNIEFDSGSEFEQYIEDNMSTITGGSSEVFTSIDSFEDIDFRDDSNKYFMIFSDNAINGGTAVDSDTLNTGVRQLSTMDMRVIAVTDSADEAIKDSWDAIVEETDGEIYSIDGVDSEEGFSEIGDKLSKDVNSRLGIGDTTDIIPGIRSQFNVLINTIAREFNAIFRQGENVYGETHDPGNNINLDLFLKIDKNLPLQMGNIVLNPAFADINKIPMSLSGDAGDNGIAEMLVGLREENIFSNSTEYSTLDEYYSNFIMELGFDAEAVSTALSNQETIVNEADKNRKEVSGVSLDEELSNMIRYQYAYGGASKMLTVIDEMLEVVVQNL
jgi:flagellar hook-associated protein 1 FlgK